MAKTATTTLQARLEAKSKQTVEQANQVLQMTADEQECFWRALQAPEKPTTAQRKLGKIMQGDA